MDGQGYRRAAGRIGGRARSARAAGGRARARGCRVGVRGLADRGRACGGRAAAGRARARARRPKRGGAWCGGRGAWGPPPPTPHLPCPLRGQGRGGAWAFRPTPRKEAAGACRNTCIVRPLFLEKASSEKSWWVPTQEMVASANFLSSQPRTYLTMCTCKQSRGCFVSCLRTTVPPRFV